MAEHSSFITGNDYIFVSDMMAAVGLNQLLGNKHHDSQDARIKIIHPSSVLEQSEPSDRESCRKLIVYLSRDPTSLLLLLKETATYLMQAETPEEVIIITPHSFNWLYYTLKSLVHPEVLCKVRAVDASDSLQDIRRLVFLSLTDECLSIQARREEIATGEAIIGLTRREYDCVLDFFCGRSIKEPFYSPKNSTVATRYSQRNAGLRKLVKQLPMMATVVRKKRVSVMGR